MIPLHYYIAFAGILVALLGQDVAGSKNVIDLEPLEDGSIVEQLCDHHMGQNKRISRISSIAKLQGYFLSGTSDATCKDFYLKPLSDLKTLVEVGSENVCNAEMMDQINAFHWNYIMGSLSKRWRKASSGTIPEPLRIFFMNYAQEVTEKCKDTLTERLTLSASNSDVVAESLYTNKFGLIINQMSNILQPQSKIRNHGDFLLLWDQLIDKETRKGRPVEKKIDPATGETILLSFKVKDPQSVRFVQQKCRQELRPIYKQTVLPVMRFISLGYGKQEKHSREDVAGSELVKNWYAITQLCQLIVPVKFYQDKSLNNEQATVMSMDESTDLPAGDVNAIAKDSSSTGSIVEIQPVRLDDILPGATNNQITKLVKSNIKARNHIYRRVFRNVLRMVNGQLKTQLKNLFITKKVGDNKYVLENGEKLFKEKVAGHEEELLHDDDMDEDKPGQLVRRKRGFFAAIFNITLFIFIMCLLIGSIYLLALTIIHIG